MFKFLRGLSGILFFSLGVFIGIWKGLLDHKW